MFRLVPLTGVSDCSTSPLASLLRRSQHLGSDLIPDAAQEANLITAEAHASPPAQGAGQQMEKEGCVDGN